jgi:FtsZ-interacting cell division protein ZipA
VLARDDVQLRREAELDAERQLGMSARHCVRFTGRSDRCASAGDEVDDENHHSHDQQQVDQASSNVKAPTKKPKDQKYREDCPKHAFTQPGNPGER